MATTVPIVFSLAPIPTGQALDANQYGQLLVANLQASMTANFLTGQTGGSMPSNNIGPWFDGTTWYAWNPVELAYLPLITNQTYNAIDNAQMQVWQRTTGFAGLVNGSITADRWSSSRNLTQGNGNVARVTSNIVGSLLNPNTQYGLQINTTLNQATIGGAEQAAITQRVERQFARPLFDKATSLSLIMLTTFPGTYCVSLRNNGGTWSYIQECVVTSPGTWQTFQFPNIPPFPTASGDWGTADTDPCYSVTVCLTAGSIFQTLPNIWASGNFLATDNQTNLFGQALGAVLIFTLVQHEPGSTCNPFAFKPFDEDLARCQRYYCQSYDYGTFPGAATNLGAIGYSTIGSAAIGYVRFPQPMRATVTFPGTLSIYSGVTGVISRIADNVAAVDRVVSAVSPSASKNGFGVINAASMTAGNVGYFHYTASADI